MTKPKCRMTMELGISRSWCPHQESNLEPQPLEAARAKFVTPCGHKVGSIPELREVQAVVDRAVLHDGFSTT